MEEPSDPTWLEDVVEYFRALGGSIHYSDLNRYIESNSRRQLPKSWEEIVRRTIEENSSDSDAWKRRLDLFRSVEGKGSGTWALRESGQGAQFPLKPAARIRRKLLRTLLGGSGQGGINATNKSPNIFIFADPATGIEHGYVDGWKDDGCFHYTGMGQRGDQEMTHGNGSILNHKSTGRALRLFDGSRDVVRYMGEFELDSRQPYYFADAPETDHGPLRQVIVFRLRAVDALQPTSVAAAPPESPLVTEIEIEEQHTKTMVIARTAGEVQAERREAELVLRLKQYLKEKGLKATSNRLAPGNREAGFRTDAYVKELNLLIEAKADSSRESFRMAIGQLADYRRFLDAPRCAILLPSQPRHDLLKLAEIEQIIVIWPVDKAFATTIKVW
jgi:hypothetical protein